LAPGRSLPGTRSACATPTRRPCTARSLTRPAALPPLRYAEQIVEKNHPLAAETLALTEMYLERRFGHADLTEADKRDFERRVRQIRGFRPQA
jgi:hypothetical protein